MLSMAKYTGCEVCAILSDGIIKFLSDESHGVIREDVEELRIDFNLAGSRRSLEVMLLNTPIKLSFFASEHNPWLTENLPDLPLGKEVPSTTSSDESLCWAIQQVQLCRQSHTTCNSHPPAALPSRVLDVRAKGESGVRLYEPVEGEKAPYICLSHCWGHRPFLRTLSGSLDAHRSEIVWDRLPQTFRDAIAFTRQLGVRYLWIDSLCIVQDDERDWRREAARMAGIYQHATLVISAAKSQGAYGGLYAELPERHKIYTVEFVPGSLYVSHDDGDDDSQLATEETPQKIHLRRTLTHPHRLLSPYHASSSSLPVFSRGWILQERFLSTRILHFGAEELSFECLCSSTCQCTPSSPTPFPSPAIDAGAPTWYTNLLTRSSNPKQYYALTTWASGSMSERELQICWRRLVEDYTRLRLTYEKDIFPAISGMAQQMQRVRGTRYMAGLWEDSAVLGDLLWHVELPPQGYVTGSGAEGGNMCDGAGGPSGGDGNQEEKEVGWEKRWTVRPAKWRAPSWSWASVKPPVEFLNPEGGVQPDCEVVEAVCEPAGPDLMGELVEGGSYLVLKGRLIPALLQFKEEKESKPWNAVDLDILDGHLKNLWADDDCRSLVAEDREQPRVYCLVVGRKLPRRELLCLVLARVPAGNSAAARDRGFNEDGHLYRRIGLLEIFGGPPQPVLWGWVHDLHRKGEDAVVTIV
ncbi:hypothetical protein VTI74DRAFT_9107 [Chaetomium olivicolor]